MMIIDEKFKIGEAVYLRTDPEQNQRIVTGILLRPNNAIEYLVNLSCNGEKTFYDIELSHDKIYL